MTTPPDIDRLIDFFQELTPESLAHFPEFYSPDAYFKDPFNEVRNLRDITRIFAHMFEQLEAPRFFVLDRLVDTHAAMLVWEFRYQVNIWGWRQTQLIRGVSHLKFAHDGKVIYHRDYWDAAEELYMKLPLLGRLMRYLQNAFSGKPGGGNVG